MQMMVDRSSLSGWDIQWQQAAAQPKLFNRSENYKGQTYIRPSCPIPFTQTLSGLLSLTGQLGLSTVALVHTHSVLQYITTKCNFYGKHIVWVSTMEITDNTYLWVLVSIIMVPATIIVKLLTEVHLFQLSCIWCKKLDITALWCTVA